MRHKRKGRILGRSPSHRKAMLKNMAASLFLTERTDDYYEILNAASNTKVNPPKPKGRIVTTLHKAKEVRPLVEKCITLARRVLADQEKADALEPDAQRNTDDWRKWRESERWNEWNQAVAPVLNARRRAIKLLDNKEAVEILFDDIAPRFSDRDGGYTRILRLAKPRLGDAGVRAILEFVGVRDRVTETAQAPSFSSDDDSSETSESNEEQPITEDNVAEDDVKDSAAEDSAAEDSAAEDSAAEDSATEESTTAEESASADAADNASAEKKSE